MRILPLLYFLYLFSCTDNSNKPAYAIKSNSVVEYASDIDFSEKDSLILTTSRRRRDYTEVADSSNSFLQIKSDTLNLHLSTGWFEGAYIFNAAITDDTALVSFRFFDNHNKYQYDSCKFQIILDKKNIRPGEYVTVKLSYNGIGKLYDGQHFRYDTVVFSGKIQLKARSENFDEEDLREENDKNRFYAEVKKRPDSVKQLFLYDSKWMTELPRELLLYTSLEELYLEGKDLSRADLNLLCNLKNLKLLDLSNCNLTSIPSCLNSLTRLEDLKLNLNHITKLPESVYELSNLKNLEVESNYITGLSSNIKKLKKLESISLGETMVVSLPDEMSMLNKLKEIYVNDTMTYIPKRLLKYIQGDCYIQR